MLLQEAREQVAEYGRELIRRGLTAGTFGNLSLYVPEAKVMVISPSGMDYDKIGPADVAVLTMDGVQLDGSRKPSSEVALHRVFYQKRPEARAVVHTHSTYATLMSCLGLPLEPIHYLIAYGGRSVPCVPYYPFGSAELAQAAWEGMGEQNAVLLGNHGLVCVGDDLPSAMDAAQQLEFVSKLCYLARLAGGGVKLTDAQLDGVMESFDGYRRRKGAK